MKQLAALLLGLMLADAVASAPVVRSELPPECRERDATPEKCVIDDGPPGKAIVRKKQPPPPPPSPPISPEPAKPKDAPPQR